MRFEFDWCQFLQTRIRANVTVVTPPGLNHDARFGAATKLFDRKAFVTELNLRLVLKTRAGHYDNRFPFSG